MIKLKIFITIVIALFAKVAFSQQDTTLVYSRPGFEKDPIRSKFKKEVLKKDSLWVVKLSDRKGVVQELVSFADEDLSIRKGPYAIFYPDGTMKEEGNYNRGYKVGVWTSYFANQKVEDKSTFSWGKLSGLYQKFWDNGELKEEVNYVNGKRAGDRNMFYKGGKPALKEFYEADKKITGAYFDKDGNKTTSGKISQPPSFPGGMQAFYDFLKKEIKYPPNAQKNGISGTVRLSFTVMKDGRIDDIQVRESPDPELSREAIRVLRYNMYWEPATELGEPVKVKHAIPIKFSLNY